MGTSCIRTICWLKTSVCWHTQCWLDYVYVHWFDRVEHIDVNMCVSMVPIT